MPDKFLTSVITDLAKLQIRIDSIPNRPVRATYEKEFDAKRNELEKVVPERLRRQIDEMIDEEILRLKQKIIESNLGEKL